MSETEGFTLKISDSGDEDFLYKTEHLMRGLRWIERDGRQVLQEAWQIHWQSADVMRSRAAVEWRDVPTEAAP